MGVIDVFPQRLAKLQRAASLRMKGFRLVLDSLENPGNRAAVIRTVEGLGLLHVHIVPCSDPKARTTRKHSHTITSGGEKWIKVHHHSTVGECVSVLKSEGFQIFTAKPENPDNDTVRNPVPIHDIDFSRNTALVFGNESSGISKEMSDLADSDFSIPMNGLTESFNVSVAAAICVHWGRVARERALGAKTDLSKEEQSDLLDHYTSVKTHYIKQMKKLASQGEKEERRRRWEEANLRANQGSGDAGS